MKITVNNQPYEVAAGASLADAARLVHAQPPFAGAVNLQFVPQNQHAKTVLVEGDRIEIIRPVTGG